MRRSLLLLGLVAVLLTAGCTSIPTSGPVRIPPTAGANTDPELVSVPNPPRPGADEQQIVQGFVLAASAGGDYSVAKRFLTLAAARGWKPTERVLVHDQSWRTTQPAEDRVELVVPAIAEVGPDGTYTPVTGRRPLGFRLVRQGGQWRIADLPDGVVLTRNSFQSLFRAVPLTFFDPTFARPVPDLRWFPSSGTGSGSAAVLRRLIAGQAPQLIGGVTATAFPLGTELTGVSRSDSGVTTVSVRTREAQSATATARMQQQIARSLPKASTATVRLVVNGVVAPSAKPLAPDSPSTMPVVLGGGRFGALDDRGVTEDALLGKRVEAAKPSAITVSARQAQAALLTARGAAVVAGSRAPRLVDQRRGLVAPTLDQSGWTYSAPRTDPSGLRATPAEGASVQVDGIPGNGTLEAIEASPDGTRMLVLLDTPSGPVCFVAGIERTAAGAPTGLAARQYLVVLAAGVTATTATWIDDDSVAVLTSASDGLDVVQQQLGGVTGSLGRPPSTASDLVGGGSVQNLLVRTADGGDLYRSARNVVWESALERPVQVSVLAVQR